MIFDLVVTASDDEKSRAVRQRDSQGNPEFSSSELARERRRSSEFLVLASGDVVVVHLFWRRGPAFHFLFSEFVRRDAVWRTSKKTDANANDDGSFDSISETDQPIFLSFVSAVVCCFP